MTERGLPAEGAPACPFVAFEDDRDGRSTAPDHRHRCFAEPRPAPRAVAHQEAYCLSSAFPVCATFQDWARREAAAARPAAAPSAPVQPADAPQSRSLPPLDRDARHTGGADAPPPLAPRRPQHRDWAAPPPWMGEGVGPAGEAPAEPGAAAGAAADSPWGDDPGDAARDAGRAAATRRPGEWGAEARGLAGSAAHRLAGPDPDEPVPATPHGMPSRRDRVPVDDDRAGLDDDAEAWAAGPGRGAWVAGAATARPTGPGHPDRSRSGPPPRRPGSPPGDDRRRPAPDGHAAGRDQVRRQTPQDAEELFGPAWERPRRYEAYPSLRTRMGLPRLGGLSKAATWGGLLVVAALALFLFGPRLLGLVDDRAASGASSAPAATAEPTATPEPTPTPAPTPQVYVVQQGDSMSGIAKRFGLTVDQLMAANPAIKNPDRIGIGDEIVIPVPAGDESGFVEGDGTVEGATPAP